MYLNPDAPNVEAFESEGVTGMRDSAFGVDLADVAGGGLIEEMLLSERAGSAASPDTNTHWQ